MLNITDKERAAVSQLNQTRDVDQQFLQSRFTLASPLFLLVFQSPSTTARARLCANGVWLVVVPDVQR